MRRPVIGAVSRSTATRSTVARSIAVRVTAACAVAGVVAAVGPPAAQGTGATALPDATAVASATGTLRVASFNIQSVATDRTSGAQKPWKSRRSAVVSTILGERPDVLGVQEANPSPSFASHLVNGDNQFLDLRNGLNSAGGNYKLTNAYAFNCVNARTNYKCVKKSRGASHSERILYNADTIELVSQGAVKYASQSSSEPRYLAYAVLRQKSTGKKFYFADTHLASSPASTTVAQWKGLVSWVKGHAAGLPVIVVGDFNTQKRMPNAKEMLPAMRRAGFGDVLNQEYMVNPIAAPRAQSTVAGWANTFNYESKDVTTYSPYTTRREKAGDNIDWVFATNSLPVLQWKVAGFNLQTLLVDGTLPSDHNMVRADLKL